MNNAKNKIKYGKVKPITEGIINRLSHHTENGFVVVSANWGELGDRDDENLSYVSKIRLGKFDEWLDKHNKIDDNEKNRSIYLCERNSTADETLKNLIIESKYSFSPVFGGYHEDGDSFERSFIIYNEPKYRNRGEVFDFNELEDFAIYICNRFVQECVYVQRPDELAIYVDMNGDVVGTANNNTPKINREQEMYYTTGRRDKNMPERFTGDITFHSPIRGKRHKNCDETIFESNYLKNFFHKEDRMDFFDRMGRTYNGEVFLDNIHYANFNTEYLSENVGDMIKRKGVNDISSVLNEDFRQSPERKGGIIVLSSDANSVPNTDNIIAEALMECGMPAVNRGKSIYSKWNNGLVELRVGKYFNDRCVDNKTNKPFNENSICMEVVGVGTPLLKKIARDAIRTLKENCVLIKDYSDDSVMIIEESK